MKEEEIYELINKLNQKEGIISSNDSISWHAHRTVEKISDDSLYPILIKIVEDNRQVKNKAIRDAAYYIIGTMLRNSFNKEACRFLIQQLGVETDKYIVSSMMDRLTWFPIPQDVDINSRKRDIRISAKIAIENITKNHRSRGRFFGLILL